MRRTTHYFKAILLTLAFILSNSLYSSPAYSEETLFATHEAGNYVPGSDLIISVNIEYEGSLTALGFEVEMPTGWSFVSAGGDDIPVILPPPKATELLEFAWITAPSSPVAFTYTVYVPYDAIGTKRVAARVTKKAKII